MRLGSAVSEEKRNVSPSHIPVSSYQRLAARVHTENHTRGRDCAIALAGLLVPEGMAYAGIAGVPPQMGLYAAMAGMFTYALFGRSRSSRLRLHPRERPCWPLS